MEKECSPMNLTDLPYGLPIHIMASSIALLVWSLCQRSKRWPRKALFISIAVATAIWTTSQLATEPSLYTALATGLVEGCIGFAPIYAIVALVLARRAPQTLLPPPA